MPPAASWLIVSAKSTESPRMSPRAFLDRVYFRPWPGWAFWLALILIAVLLLVARTAAAQPPAVGQVHAAQIAATANIAADHDAGPASHHDCHGGFGCHTFVANLDISLTIAASRPAHDVPAAAFAEDRPVRPLDHPPRLIVLI
jgi:hypothetical protein